MAGNNALFSDKASDFSITSFFTDRRFVAKGENLNSQNSSPFTLENKNQKKHYERLPPAEKNESECVRLPEIVLFVWYFTWIKNGPYHLCVSHFYVSRTFGFRDNIQFQN